MSAAKANSTRPDRRRMPARTTCIPKSAADRWLLQFGKTLGGSGVVGPAVEMLADDPAAIGRAGRGHLPEHRRQPLGLFLRGTPAMALPLTQTSFSIATIAAAIASKATGTSTPRLAKPASFRKADSLGRYGDRPRLADETSGQRRGIAHDELVLLVAHERRRRQGAEPPQHRGEADRLATDPARALEEVDRRHDDHYPLGVRETKRHSWPGVTILPCFRRRKCS